MRLIFDNIVFSLQQTGGISVVWFELLKRLLKDKNMNCIFVEYGLSKDNICRKALSIKKELTIKSRSMIPLSIRRFFNPSLFVVRDKFIFHSSYYRICTNKNAINITTVHDFTYEYFKKGYRKKIHCWQKYRAIRRSDIIVCVSENTKRDLMTFLPEIDVGKIRVIYNGVSDNYYKIRSKVAGLPYDYSTYAIFIGSRDTYKNYDLAVEAVAASNLNFVIVGTDLTDQEKVFLNNKIGKHRYCLLKKVSEENLNRLYNGAFVLLYLSSYEGFGIPVLEAQKAGCPVIACNRSSIPEIIGDTPLLVNELSTREILHCFEILKGKIREDIVQKGITNANRFSWDANYKNYVDIYKEAWSLR